MAKRRKDDGVAKLRELSKKSRKKAVVRKTVSEYEIEGDVIIQKTRDGLGWFGCLVIALISFNYGRAVGYDTRRALPRD